MHHEMQRQAGEVVPYTLVDKEQNISNPNNFFFIPEYFFKNYFSLFFRYGINIIEEGHRNACFKCSLIIMCVKFWSLTDLIFWFYIRIFWKSATSRAATATSGSSTSWCPRSLASWTSWSRSAHWRSCPSCGPVRCRTTSAAPTTSTTAWGTTTSSSGSTIRAWTTSSTGRLSGEGNHYVASAFIFTICRCVESKIVTFFKNCLFRLNKIILHIDYSSVYSFVGELRVFFWGPDAQLCRYAFSCRFGAHLPTFFARVV